MVLTEPRAKTVRSLNLYIRESEARGAYYRKHFFIGNIIFSSEPGVANEILENDSISKN